MDLPTLSSWVYAYQYATEPINVNTKIGARQNIQLKHGLGTSDNNDCYTCTSCCYRGNSERRWLQNCLQELEIAGERGEDRKKSHTCFCSLWRYDFSQYSEAE
jgi:hypothetical protein